MCRIAGMIAPGFEPGQIHEKVRIMCNVLQHGGPDDEGFFTDNNARLVFGHRRLAIIDLSKKGHQPMADVYTKAWITFNGEIYNYRDLKEQLIKIGAGFNSNTDTEVIIQAYLHWGEAAFAKLQGMFAFALYDVAKQVTYLVRDTSGIKPLYYHIENNRLSFASEVKALNAAGIANQTDEAWKVRFLAYGHIPEPYTTLKNVYNLAKGHFLCWHHANGSFVIKPYTITATANLFTNFERAKTAIKHGLQAAINRQLMADAPIGVFLSGGIDSSIIALLAAAGQQQQHLKTISIFFDEKAYDERAYQSAVLDKMPGEKFSHLVKQPDFESCFPQITTAMDMPTTDGINTWFISKYAHDDGLKAVLSGIGGDELFGGYPSFNRIKYIKYLRKLPPSLFKAANWFTADKYKKMAYLAYDSPIADYLLLRGLFVTTDIAKILNTDEKEVAAILFGNDNYTGKSNYDKEQASWFETNLYMQNQLLRDTDVMSMSHGLEVRVPFLDENFRQVVQNIIPQIRFNGQQPKELLVDSFKDILPEAVWNRRKMGFSFPLQQWMKQHDAISNENLYRGKEAKTAINSFKNGQVHWSKAFALYQLQLHG